MSKAYAFETVWATSSAPSESVYELITDLRAHLIWSGERASDDKFKLLTLDAPKGPATTGATFTSTGANFNGTFHDRSVVTEASRPHRFIIETDARLERNRGKSWEVHFVHRYDTSSPSGMVRRLAIPKRSQGSTTCRTGCSPGCHLSPGGPSGKLTRNS